VSLCNLVGPVDEFALTNKPSGFVVIELLRQTHTHTHTHTHIDAVRNGTTNVADIYQILLELLKISLTNRAPCTVVVSVGFG
jgi:hypothetical protein